VKVKEKVFPCLSCGFDTGCPNKLICDKCRASRKQKLVLVHSRKVVQTKSRFQLKRHI